MKQGSNSVSSDIMLGGYFPISETAARLSLELPDADPLTVEVQAGSPEKLDIVSSDRALTWTEIRLIEGLLAALARYSSDKELARLTGGGS